MEEPFEAVARAVGFVEHVGTQHGVVNPVQMTVATADGESIWAFRYSSEGRTRSLFYSSDVAELRQVYPDMDVLDHLGEETRLAVSEQLLELQGVARGPRVACADVERPVLRWAIERAVWCPLR